MLEELSAGFRVEHVVMTTFKLCVECESYTGERAVRQVTPDGRCATCGSASVMRLVEHEWPWLKKKEEKEEGVKRGRKGK